MVAAKQVWEALAEIPDPEIPVISLVDLGVIRGVEVENGRVRVDFTPTFLGCPAIEVMQTAMAERIRELGAEPEVRGLVHVAETWARKVGGELAKDAIESCASALSAPVA